MKRALIIAQDWVQSYIAEKPKRQREIEHEAQKKLGVSLRTLQTAQGMLFYALNDKLNLSETRDWPWRSFRRDGHWFWGDERQWPKPDKDAPFWRQPDALAQIPNLTISKLKQHLEKMDDLPTEEMDDQANEVYDALMQTLGEKEAAREQETQHLRDQTQQRQQRQQFMQSISKPRPIWQDAVRLAEVIKSGSSDDLQRQIDEIDK